LIVGEREDDHIGPCHLIAVHLIPAHGIEGTRSPGVVARLVSWHSLV
jgi:hypothetical protein